MLNKGTCLRFYKRKDIQEAILAHAKDKEIAVRYEEWFGKRPDVLNYPREILELALRGTTSFHSSEERWENPLSLNSEITKKELNELRIGWDLVLDIDCKFIEYSKICADLIIKFLKYCGVVDYSCKFSGNKGFHIGIPFEAFPQKVGELETKYLFPDAAKKIALYIKDNIEEELGRRILEYEGNNFSIVKEKVELSQEEIVRYVQNELGDNIAKLNVDKFLEIDTVLISSRHLYRMPYSLHEKSGLVSLPINPDKVMEFEKKMANPDVILTPMFIFLDRNVSGDSARRLLVQALDYEVKIEEEREQKEYEKVEITSPIKEEFFPPCIKLILAGMEDGKKRSVFSLMNFLGKIGWSKEEVESYLHKWNKDKNHNPLREVYIKGQMHSFKPGAKLPPNCSNAAYYIDMGICKPDGLCKKIKNPVNYSIIKWKSYLRDNKKTKKDEGSKGAHPGST
jgi:DNA primase catalytic subunit